MPASISTDSGKQVLQKSFRFHRRPCKINCAVVFTTHIINATLDDTLSVGAKLEEMQSQQQTGKQD